MTRVRYGRTGDRCRLELRGHAAGSSAACAGLSALTNALTLYLERYPVCVHALEEGEGVYRLDFTGGDAAAVWECVVLGIRSIAAAYPEQVVIGGEKQGTQGTQMEPSEAVPFGKGGARE